jgi:hypothetical protein
MSWRGHSECSPDCSCEAALRPRRAVKEAVQIPFPNWMEKPCHKRGNRQSEDSLTPPHEPTLPRVPFPAKRGGMIMEMKVAHTQYILGGLATSWNPNVLHAFSVSAAGFAAQRGVHNRAPCAGTSLNNTDPSFHGGRYYVATSYRYRLGRLRHNTDNTDVHAGLFVVV